MFTTTKTRKAVINQNQSAVALVKVCGGYKVFTDCEEIAMWERNTGRALPKTAYVGYKRPAKAAQAPTPESEEKMERTKETIEAEIKVAKATFESEYAAAKQVQKVDRVVNEGGDGYARSEGMMEAAYNKMRKIVKPLEAELFALEWNAIAPKDIKKFGTNRASIKLIASQAWGVAIEDAQGALQKAIKMHNL